MPLRLERISFNKPLPVELMQTHFSRGIWVLSKCDGKSVLDVGCGMGYITWLIGQRATDVIGLDSSPEAIEEARDTFDGTFVECSIEDFEGGPFEVVVAFEMVEHCKNLDAVLEKIKSLLIPEGKAIISLPLHQPSEFHHYRDFDYGLWCRKLREHFKIAGVSYQPMEHPLGSNVTIFNLAHENGEVVAWPAAEMDEYGFPAWGIVIFQLEAP